MTRRRVLFVEANEDGTVGGSHQVLYDMIREMNRAVYEPVVLFYQDNRFATLCREAGFEVVVWTDIRQREIEANHSSGPLGKLIALQRAIARRKAFLRSHRIDLVHMNNSPRTGRDDWLPAARLHGVPIVASARGDAEPLPGVGMKVAVGRHLMRRFDRIIPVSEYIAEAMRAQGMPADRVIVVHDGVDRSELARLSGRSAAEIRAELQVPAGRMFVAAIGNIRSWKGQHVVIAALAALQPEQRARLCVVFVGAVRIDDEAYFASLAHTVRENGLEDAVRFAGMRTDVPDILSVADVMVHASTTPEPGGTVVIESMTFGAPVVVASRGGHLDYLQEGLGLIHDVEDPTQLARHLLALADDPDERQRMAAAAKVRAAAFSIERTARKMEAIYEELLSGPSSAPVP
jgi:glycosyltransferase involved in cell wall biosynthesis